MQSTCLCLLLSLSTSLALPEAEPIAPTKAASPYYTPPVYNEYTGQGLYPSPYLSHLGHIKPGHVYTGLPHLPHTYPRPTHTGLGHYGHYPTYSGLASYYSTHHYPHHTYPAHPTQYLDSRYPGLGLKSAKTQDKLQSPE